ncbi:hypothetical protein GX411_11400 [Candidatus Fermentibacteria bacterium]|nr:hypothetical protein [Candidatus Fermentibacteria bacterium]
MSRWLRFAGTVLAASLGLAAAGCWNPFAPDQGGGGGGPEYYEFCDSAYKVVKNLQYAYNSRDLYHYLDCFRSDFEFHLLQVDYDDYDGDGIEDTYWGLDLEEAFHEQMFAMVYSIDLDFISNSPWQNWYGDPTGQSQRSLYTFDLKVYTGQSEGYQAIGEAEFICRPDSTGEYYIWQWWDHSET